MLAQLLCELALLSADCAACKASMLAGCALCLSLGCLRCGLWRDGSPGPSTASEQYWTASMTQATGYSRSDLREPLQTLQQVRAPPRLALSTALSICVSRLPLDTPLECFLDTPSSPPLFIHSKIRSAPSLSQPARPVPLLAPGARARGRRARDAPDAR